MNINRDNMVNVLAVMIKDDEIFARMKSDHPQILADLLTFRENPNCSCRTKVSNYFSNKMESFGPNVILNYLEGKDGIIRIIKDSIAFTESKILSGKILRVKKGEKEWADFWKSCSSKIFRSFCILDRGEELEVYFL